jgi:16S rRNA (uracil1498-N3)-methyltransferase
MMNDPFTSKSVVSRRACPGASAPGQARRLTDSCLQSAMSDRFYSAQPITAERVKLDGPEAHHLLHVMRAKVGQRVTLFDGGGAEFDAEIVKCNRADVEVRIDARRDVDRELPFELVVGVSLPKGDRQKWLVEKLTELGVSQLVPLETERGVAQPTESALERLSRSVIEAAKQCGRNRLMRVAKPQAWGEWVGAEKATRQLISHPDGSSLASHDLSQPLPTQFAIGPEGGFTDAEVAAAVAAGWQSVNLGRRILRVETAAVALAAVVALAAHP